MENYPPHTHGRNIRDEYADVEAIRVDADAFAGPEVLLTELWEKYKIPIAITEVHLHCHRDEQMRWFNYMWNTATELKKKQVDIRAVTSWAMLGSFGWNKLLTQPHGDYEAGVFDVRSGKLRPLAMTELLKQIANHQTYNHPVLNRRGWWQRNIRILYPSPRTKKSSTIVNKHDDKTKPLLIIGKTGTLGKAFARICEIRNIHYRLLGRNEIDISNEKKVAETIAALKPWAVINAAGYVRVDDAETNLENCFSSNSRGPAYLAKYCSENNTRLLNFSSDLVFDGNKKEPYVESDKVCPLNMYGRSKVIAEQNVLRFFPGALIIRTSAFFGPWDDYNFISMLIKSLAGNTAFDVINDVTISPTYVPDLANTSLDLLLDNEQGIWHIANDGEITWAELAKKVAEKLNLNTELIHAKPLREFSLAAERPVYSVLKSDKGIKLPSLNDALERFYAEINYISYTKNYSVV